MSNLTWNLSAPCIPAYYAPTREKLEGLGFVQVGSPDAGGVYYSAPTADDPDEWMSVFLDDTTGDITLMKQHFGPHNVPEDVDALAFRISTEADFDRLLWQVGWTDVEPVNEADRLRETIERLGAAFVKATLRTNNWHPGTICSSSGATEMNALLRANAEAELHRITQQ